MNISFVKYCATGNDFVILDNREDLFNHLTQKDFALLCHRRFGIGADGVLLLEKSLKHDFKMRYLNSDGAEVEMCGNGARSIAYFAHHNIKLKKENDYIFETMADLCRAEVLERDVNLKMGQVDFLRIDLDDLKKQYFFKSSLMLNTGVPHAVFELEEGFRGLDIIVAGRAIRHDKRFEKGTNVNFFYIGKDEKGQKHVYLRTYERGVEAETLSCGTGAVATALFCAKVYDIPSPIIVHMIGGDLNVSFDRDGDKFFDVFLKAEVTEVFSGTFSMRNMKN